MHSNFHILAILRLLIQFNNRKSESFPRIISWKLKFQFKIVQFGPISFDMKAYFKKRPKLVINEMKYLYKCDTLVYSIFVAFSKKTLTLHLIKSINNYLTFSAFMRFPLEINSRNFCSSRRNFISIIFFGFSK